MVHVRILTSLFVKAHYSPHLLEIRTLRMREHVRGQVFSEEGGSYSLVLTRLQHRLPVPPSAATIAAFCYA